MLRKLILSLVIVGLFVGCQTQEKGDIDDYPSDDKEFDQNKTDDQKAGEQPETPDGSFVNKNAPKLGIILGGGGVLTYAQLGVLRELAAQKISVHAITGLEWGAMIAATYSLNGQAHEAEWQMLKLPYKKFQSSGVFSSSNRVAVGDFDKYFKQTFKGKRIKDGAISFTCPYIDIQKRRIRMAQNGKYSEVMKMCWPYAPLFQYKSRMACPLGIREAVGNLRKRGAELILYVDVIDKNLLFTADQRKRHPAANLMWLQAKTVAGGIKHLGVDEVISIPLGASNYLAYESMRLLVRMGQMKSRPLVKKFAKKYEY